MSVASLEYRLSTLTALLGVVEALRSLTAAKQQKALVLRPAVETFADLAEQTLHRLDPEPPAGASLVTLVLGPEAGFTGGLAGRIAAAVPEAWTPLVVGARMAATLRARHRLLINDMAAPVAADSLPALAIALAEQVPAGAAIAVLHQQGNDVIRTDLHPLPARSGRHDLLTHLPATALVSAAGRQVREARLLRLLLSSHIAEQMARLATLTGARERIRDRIADLSVQIAMARQDGISQEIADLWAGRRIKSPGALT